MAETITSEVAAPMGETYDVDALLSSFLSDPGEKKAKPETKAEDKPAPKPEEKPAVKAEPEKPKHSKAMIRLGRSLGFTEAEMDAMAEEELEDGVFARQVETAAEAKAAKTQPKPEVKPEEWKPDFGEGVDLSEVDDNIKKALENIAKENAALKKELKSRDEAVVNHHRQSMSERLDGIFSQHPEMFGAGPSAKIGARSKEAARRGSVLHQMDRIAQMNGKADPEADFVAACEAIGFELKKPEGTTVADADTQRWASAGLARPQQRQDEPKPKGDARAEEAAGKALERGGFVVGSDKMVSIDSFPD